LPLAGERPNDLPRSIDTAAVDDEDFLEAQGDRLSKRRRNRPLLVERRDDDGDAHHLGKAKA
jgi:hypothetical protein